MKFCETCNNILVVKNSVNGRVLFCRYCNKEYPLLEDVILSSSLEEQKVAKVETEQTSEFAVTKILCPKCETEREAEWTIQQTRGADEPPTRFYRCKTCGNVWREYS